MGYGTYFKGRFQLDRALSPEHQAALEELADEEHYDAEDGMPVRDVDTGHPAIYCQWKPTEDGTEIEDFGEKFYGGPEWLQYLVEKRLKPWGYILNGEVRWQHENWEDAGIIYVRDNRIEAVRNVNPGPSWDRKFVPVT
jgi:hypothetical protein